MSIFPRGNPMKKTVYGICGMCTVRCPMMSVVEDGTIRSIHGNPHAGGIKGALCARARRDWPC